MRKILKERDRLQLLRSFDYLQQRNEGKVKARNIRRGSYDECLAQAGIELSVPIWICLVLMGNLFSSLLFNQILGGLVAFMLGPFLSYYFLFPYLHARAEKRRRRAVIHLPGFIDTTVASLRTGYNMAIAVEHATQTLPEGILKKEFREAISLIDRQMPLEEALEYVLRRIAGREIVSLVTTLRLFSGLGGRALQPLNRLSGKMRAQQVVLERAARDLMSTRQAFYVIMSLSVIAPLLLTGSDPEYFLGAFHHPQLRYVMQMAIVIQVMCIFAFKKLTTLRI